MPRAWTAPRELWAGLAVALVCALLFGHGAVLARAGLPVKAVGAPSRVFELILGGMARLGIGAEAASAAVGAAAAALSLVLVVALATGTEGAERSGGSGLSRLIPPLVPALLLAASPLFARSLFLDGEEMLFTALMLAGGYRAFVETHTPGHLLLSALCFGLASAMDCASFLAIVLVALQKLLFARKFGLPRAVYGFAFVWLGVGLIAAATAYFLLGGGRNVPVGTGGVGLGRSLTTFVDEVNGLALLPFVGILCLAWKPKEVFFRLTLAAAILMAIVIMAARVPEERLGFALAPALPWAFLIAGEGFRAANAILETSGFRARERVILGAIVVGSLVIALLWPTLTGCVR